MASQKRTKSQLAEIDALAREMLVAGGLAALPAFEGFRARKYWEVAASARKIAEQFFDIKGVRVTWIENDVPAKPSAPKQQSAPRPVLARGWYTETGKNPRAIYVTKAGGYHAWAADGSLAVGGSSLPSEAATWRAVTWHDIRVGTEWMGFSTKSRDEMNQIARDDKCKLGLETVLSRDDDLGF